MSTFPFRRGALVAALLALIGPSLAQTASSGVTLTEVTVTGHPLRNAEGVAPAQALSGTNLLLRSQGTLGETLNATPGVSSTYFGPNASRPSIRGLDGDRIRLLSNSGASIDASGVSYDHAVAMDPISIQRIEVLRGPGALLYGGSAVGGAVNVIDNRIPSEPGDGAPRPDPVEPCGRGRHVRFVVEKAKTAERLAAKRAKAGM